MALASDDSDIRETWLKSYIGGNGDPYIEIVYRDQNGFKCSTSVRIAVHGGKAPSEVKTAAANLAKAMQGHFASANPGLLEKGMMEAYSKSYYEMADAMLKERENTKNK